MYVLYFVFWRIIAEIEKKKKGKKRREKKNQNISEYSQFQLEINTSGKINFYFLSIPTKI